MEAFTIESWYNRLWEPEHDFKMWNYLIMCQTKKTRRSECEKLFETVFDVVVSAERKENSEQLIDGNSQAVNVIGVTLQLGL